MFYVTLVFFFLFALVSWNIAALSLNGRIIGGNKSTIESHPYQVSIQMSNRGHICGGTLISESIVVTAAHCVEILPEHLLVRVGSTDRSMGGELVAIKDVHIHEDYDTVTNDNDIAVITLVRKLNETSKIRYLSLATKIPRSGTRAVVSGWGLEEEDFGEFPFDLREVEVKIISRKNCSSRQYEYGHDITRTMFCAYADGKDSCEGDSGSGLVVNNSVLVGIVSFGYGCAEEQFPGVYVNVPFFRNWILTKSGLKS